MAKLLLGLCQIKVTDIKQENVAKAVSMINACKNKNVNIAVLPEMFNCPYDTSSFPLYAEEFENSETLSVISDAARYNDMYIVAGSVPELYKDKIYNTCVVFDRTGKMIGKHRKIHLFDIDVKNGISFRESDILSGGNQITVIDTEYCKIGVAICFDIRFSDLYREMSKEGAKIIFTPGAFNMTTGPAHWELLVRSRALDNQVYHAAVSAARNCEAGYISYGNSMLCNPWGDVTVRADEKEQIILGEVDLEMVDSIREQIPVVKTYKTT